MKKSQGIPCAETRHTMKADKNQICFRFVTDDANTPSACTVRIGDTDPVTGEAITDMTFFREYYRMADHDIYSYWKSLRPYRSAEEKKQQKEKKAEISARFEAEYGYRPCEADLQWMANDFMPERMTISIDRFRDAENSPDSDRLSEFGYPCEDPFAENEPDEILQLREIAGSLSGRMADVYEWLLIRHAGGKVKASLADIAAKWGISLTRAYKDRDEIIQMIRDGIKQSIE